MGLNPRPRHGYVKVNALLTTFFPQDSPMAGIRSLQGSLESSSPPLLDPFIPLPSL